MQLVAADMRIGCTPTCQQGSFKTEAKLIPICLGTITVLQALLITSAAVHMASADAVVIYMQQHRG
jgi:hypothetical protein